MAQSLWGSRKENKDGDDAPVFAGQDGQLLERAAAHRAVKAAAKQAGVPWAGLKTLRHTCATLLFRRGLNPKQVQAWLGHHSAGFTLATYVHLLPDDLPSPDFLDEVTAAPSTTERGERRNRGRDLPARSVSA